MKLRDHGCVEPFAHSSQSPQAGVVPRALPADVGLKNGASTSYGLGVEVSTREGGRFMIEHSGEGLGIHRREHRVSRRQRCDRGADQSGRGTSVRSNCRTDLAGVVRHRGCTGREAGRRRRAIFEGLQHGTIDRSLFTSNANSYFSVQALKDFASSLGPLGALTGFVQTRKADRGGMVYRSYRASFPNRTLRAWTYETPDGKLEQYQVAPQG